ncbi:MAG TPA: penicillin acylase family protein [Roseiflexaceae bacterium]|nr:penicillin acylase family protein [Roseiflexaceae bacterium]
MRIVLKIVLRVLAVLLVVLLVGGLAGGMLVWRSWPERSGRLSVAGLNGPVDVLRDPYGVPHIYAANEHDLFFAQGYVHAQDRLWQMDFQRRVGLGRLSEILGPDSREFDVFLRTFGVNRSAQQDLTALSPETRRVLEAYSAGVNAFISANGSRLPPEYTILQASPIPWEPLHTLAWMKMMQFELNSSWQGDLVFSQLQDALGAEQAQELTPDYPADGALIVPEIARGALGTPGLARVQAAFARAGIPFGSLARGLGSNAAVVGPAHTSTGRPILANDPHLQLGTPAIWYQVGLHAPGYEVVGASLPGTFGVIIGHNAQIAWGVTNMPADVQDLFVERLNPANPDEYEVNGSFVPFEIVTEQIAIKGQAPVDLRVKISRHGPLINEAVEGATVPLAFQWRAARQPTTIVNAIVPLNRAQDWAGFRQALAQWDAPAQNFVYADTEGNIGYYGAGAVPQRETPFGMGTLPGWSDDYSWGDDVPFAELPQAFNPPDGLIVTANNKPVSDEYPHYLGYAWEVPNRANRILAHLVDNDQLDLDDLAATQLDDLSTFGQQLAPALAALGSEDPLVQAAQQQLDGWDGRMRPDSAGAGVFAATAYFLGPQIVRDELAAAGITDEDTFRRANDVRFITGLLADPAASWWDDVGTPEREERDAILLRALQEAIAWWRTAAGDTPSSWTWGSVHTVTFRHAAFGYVTPLDMLFNVPAGPIGGDALTPLATSFWWPFGVEHGPGYRQVLDVGAWGDSRSIISVGQSGQLWSPHFRDQAPLWSAGASIPLHWERAAIEQLPGHNLLQLAP